MANEFSQHIFDQLAELGEIEMGRFFGGTGFKIGGVQFAMCMGSSLYLVVNDQTRGKYQQAGSGPFSYNTRKGQRLVHRYYQVPDEILEDHDQLIHWVQESIGISIKSRNL